MTVFEYSVIPAPERGEKTKGAKTASERFSHALTAELNRMATEGWEYLRAEILPTEERSGLTGRTTVYHNMLVFRRAFPVAPVQPFSQPMQMTAAPQVKQVPAGRNETADPKTNPDLAANDHNPVDAPAD